MHEVVSLSDLRFCVVIQVTILIIYKIATELFSNQRMLNVCITISILLILSQVFVIFGCQRGHHSDFNSTTMAIINQQLNFVEKISATRWWTMRLLICKTGMPLSSWPTALTLREFIRNSTRQHDSFVLLFVIFLRVTIGASRNWNMPPTLCFIVKRT